MIFAAIASIIIGLILSAPYALLTGGNLNDFIVIIIIAPCVSFSLFLFWMEKKSNPDLRIFSRPIMASILLPIALNGLSAALRFLGYAEAGNLLFASRYYSFWLAISGIFAYTESKKNLP